MPSMSAAVRSDLDHERVVARLGASERVAREDGRPIGGNGDALTGVTIAAVPAPIPKQVAVRGELEQDPVVHRVACASDVLARARDVHRAVGCDGDTAARVDNVERRVRALPDKLARRRQL
jgi:hypothetical protein